MEYKRTVKGWWAYLGALAELEAQAATDFPDGQQTKSTQVVNGLLEITVRVKPVGSANEAAEEAK